MIEDNVNSKKESIGTLKQILNVAQLKYEKIKKEQNIIEASLNTKQEETENQTQKIKKKLAEKEEYLINLKQRIKETNQTYEESKLQATTKINTNNKILEELSQSIQSYHKEKLKQEENLNKIKSENKALVCKTAKPLENVLFMKKNIFRQNRT